MNVLAVIPARGGSKSIPHKNLAPLAGIPLIAHTLIAVHEAKTVFDHVVSTDNAEIAAAAQQYGGQVPFLRDPALASDEANIVDVLIDLLRRLERQYDYMLLLQPTAPLRTGADIDAALALARESGSDSVCSFTPMDTYHPRYMYYLRDAGVEQIYPTAPGTPRQAFEEVAWRNGAIYLVKADVLMRERIFVTEDCVPYLMPRERSVNIDSADDLRLAEFYLRDRQPVTHAQER
ncbi:MAG: acylneuraminate cytidylyltransferase [Candidatus Andersenbacteria bacterium CG10_big_fil_rev_8_21_14_0_10_54_11]|uniref:Acylneuraminate cytidylyltransferase n=1 Tax=Candidatus Andersenbacteria bacterium CG10_big_fil_rev_8_21_14_0_10_54_11 TaxID=1974485 RepID=A0A2M6WZB0_9BACT|nr:MAG: acylneuraminate cytidylyltransferase [Candidatus Andersenbacteria bacterium CG10_big_fil_rev_8_21_14_0_10_54_11]